jgi:hypothetical protein
MYLNIWLIFSILQRHKRVHLISQNQLRTILCACIEELSYFVWIVKRLPCQLFNLFRPSCTPVQSLTIWSNLHTDQKGNCKKKISRVELTRKGVHLQAQTSVHMCMKREGRDYREFQSILVLHTLLTFDCLVGCTL